MEHTTRQGAEKASAEALRAIAGLLELEPMQALGRLLALDETGTRNPLFHILHARALIALERYVDAAEATERALEAGGMTQEVLSLQLHALSRGGDLARLEQVVESGMTEPRLEFRNVLAMAQSARLLTQSEHAVRLYELLIQNRPRDASLPARLGVIHGSRGETELAARCFDAAIELEPTAAQCRYQLSCLKRQTTSDNNMASLHKAWAEMAPAKGADDRQRAYLAYALGKELEDLEDYEAAFSWYLEGAKAERKRIRYSFDEERKLYEGIKAFHEHADPRGRAGFLDDAPIFIVSLPRTGSTLTEILLARHSRVRSAGELPTFREALKAELGLRDGRNALEQWVEGSPVGLDFSSLGRRYIAMTRTKMTQGLRFTDKMPGNHLLLGLIAQALPDARLICVTRDLADSCMSAFKQLFAPGSYTWSYDLEEAARHCLLHDALTRFWITHLRDRVLEVRYEELVTEPEATARDILKFCDLDWEDACLDPESVTGSINTPSAAQVRRPIYTSSVRRWRKFEAGLEPALRILRGEDPDSCSLLR